MGNEFTSDQETISEILEEEFLMEKESRRARALLKKGINRDNNELVLYLINDFKDKDRRLQNFTPTESEALRTLLSTIEPNYVFEDEFNIVEKIEAIRWSLMVSESTHRERMVGLLDHLGRHFKLDDGIIKILVWQPERLGLAPTNGLRLFRRLTGGTPQLAPEPVEVNEYAAPLLNKPNISLVSSKKNQAGDYTQKPVKLKQRKINVKHN